MQRALSLAKKRARNTVRLFGVAVFVCVGAGALCDAACSGDDSLLVDPGEDVGLGGGGVSSVGGASGGGIARDAADDGVGLSDGDAADEVGGSDSADARPIDSGFVVDGPSVFTFFHGVSNAEYLRVCFQSRVDDEFVSVRGQPMPNSTLGYGRAFSLYGLDDVDLELRDVRSVVYAGSLDAISGKGCEEVDEIADAGLLPTGLSRALLPVIPAGTLSRGRSVLLVVTGCTPIGVGYYPNTTAVCGSDFNATVGNVGMMVASMSRSKPTGAIGIQVFAASPSSPAIAVEHFTAFPATPLKLVSNLSSGKIAPHPPSTELIAVNLGTIPNDNTLRVYLENAPNPAFETRLVDALARGNLSLASLQDGENFTIVVAGPHPTATADWHQRPVVTVLRSDP